MKAIVFGVDNRGPSRLPSEYGVPAYMMGVLKYWNVPNFGLV